MLFLGLTHTAEFPLAQPMKVSYLKLQFCVSSISLLLVGFPWRGPFSRDEANTRHAAAVLALPKNASVGDADEQMQPSKPVWTACTRLSVLQAVPSASAMGNGHHALQTDGHEH